MRVVKVDFVERYVIYGDESDSTEITLDVIDSSDSLVVELIER